MSLPCRPTRTQNQTATGWLGRRLHRFVAIGFGCAAIALAVSLTVGAHDAQSADTKIAYIGWSSIKITEPEFDFGGEGFLAGAPTQQGRLDWYIVDGRIQPILEGYLHLKDAGGLCGRMRMDYYANGILLTTKFGREICAPDDKRFIGKYHMDEYMSNKLDEVRVSIEKLTADKKWTIVGSHSRKLIPLRLDVKITEDGFDFGGRTFAVGVPTNSAEVIWTWDQGQVHPRVVGTLHINNAATACARLRIEYFDVTHTRLTEQFSGKMCAPDNQHYIKEIDLDAFKDNALTHLRIELQTLGADDTWRTIGSANSTYALYLDPNASYTVVLGGGSLNWGENNCDLCR